VSFRASLQQFRFVWIGDRNGFRPMFLGLLKKKTNIVSGGEAHQAYVIGQVLRDFDGAGTNRPRATTTQRSSYHCRIG